MPREIVEVSSTTPDKRNTYGWVPPLIGIICLGLMIFFAIYHFRDRVEQKFRSGQLCTYVWLKDEIAKSWYDPTDSVIKYPGLKAQRRQEAETVLAKLKGTYKPDPVKSDFLNKYEKLVDSIRLTNSDVDSVIITPTDTVVKINWQKFRSRMECTNCQRMKLTPAQKKKILKRWYVAPVAPDTLDWDWPLKLDREYKIEEALYADSVKMITND